MVSHWHLHCFSRGDSARRENVTVAVRPRSALAIWGQGAAWSRHKAKVVEQTQTRGRRWDETGGDGEHRGQGWNWKTDKIRFQILSDTIHKKGPLFSPLTRMFSNLLQRRKSSVAFIVLGTWIKNKSQRHGCFLKNYSLRVEVKLFNTSSRAKGTSAVTQGHNRPVRHPGR